MEPLFYTGQKIVCIVRKNRPGAGCGDSELVEGKTYTVQNPYAQIWKGNVYIDIHGLSYRYLQTQFVPIDTDRALENEIHEALKGQKIIV